MPKGGTFSGAKVCLPLFSGLCLMRTMGDGEKWEERQIDIINTLTVSFCQVLFLDSDNFFHSIFSMLLFP